MFQKTKRIINRKLLALYAKKRCAIVYGLHMGGVAGHHIKSKGSGGGDVEENLIPLCSNHHTGLGHGIHTMGVGMFLKEYRHRMAKVYVAKLEKYIAGRTG